MAKPKDKRTQMIAGFLKKPPPEPYKRRAIPTPMPGPNAPDPESGNGVLPPRATRAGAYFLPGFGDVARAKNRQRYRDKHAFNPGRYTGGQYS